MKRQSVERLFALAIEVPSDRRQALLEGDAADSTVREEVARLLAQHDRLCSEDSAAQAFLHTLDLGRAAALVEAVDVEPASVGRYDIIRPLGRGATGVVYLAHDPALGRSVALKLLAPALSGDPAALRRFTEEARAASSLDHPNIATVYEIGEAGDGRLFIVMAYYEGETLRERLSRGMLPVEEAVTIASGIASGLAAAHARGIVHRDIKPENIMLTPNGACIVDFGIAKIAGQTLTRTGSVLGTAAYMSPEQTTGSSVDQRSDLWSLGVVLYEMLTGTRPFQADGGEALVYGIRHDAPALLSARRPDVPDTVLQVVERCLEKDPARRYQSAGDLRSALFASPQHVGVARHWPWAALGLVVAAAALGTGVLARPGPPPLHEKFVQLSTVLPIPRPPGAIAILPSAEGPADESLDGRQYLIEGIAEGIRDELTRGLSGTPGVRVTERASGRVLTDAGADVQELGRRLGVAAVLKWTLHRSDSLVTVAAQLLRTSDGGELWSHTYEGPLEALGTVPGEIRRSVAGVLGLRASPADAGRPITKDMAAYDLYQRGRFAQSKWTPAGEAEAEDFFLAAIARDSSFALAYVRLAEVYRHNWSVVATTQQTRRAKPLLAKALAIDSMLAPAHAMAGRIAMWLDRDWAVAEQHLSRALALDSSDIGNYLAYANYLAVTGRTHEGLALARRATAVDPVSSIAATQVGIHLFRDRQYTEAIKVLERAMSVDTMWGKEQRIVLARAYLAVGRNDEGIRLLRNAGMDDATGFEAPALLAYGLGKAGRKGEATTLVAQYVARARSSAAEPMDLVAVHLGVGDTARAFDWLERIPEDRGAVCFLLGDPMFDPLRNSPRFHRVIEQLGLAGVATRPGQD